MSSHSVFGHLTNHVLYCIVTTTVRFNFGGRVEIMIPRRGVNGINIDHGPTILLFNRHPDKSTSLPIDSCTYIYNIL